MYTSYNVRDMADQCGHSGSHSTHKTPTDSLARGAVHIPRVHCAAVAAWTCTLHTCRSGGTCATRPCAGFASITSLASDHFRGGEAMSRAHACASN